MEGEDVAAEGGETEAIEAGESQADGEATTSDEPRYSYSRRGEEREATGKELAAMLADDFEDEFPAGAGKEPIRANREQIERALQQRNGYMTGMRRYNEAIKRLGSEREMVKQDPAQFAAYVEHAFGNRDGGKFSLFGHEGYEAFIAAEMDRILSEEGYDQEGNQRPLTAEQQIKIAQARLDRRNAVEKRLGQRQQQEAAAQQREQGIKSVIDEALKAHGIHQNHRTRRLAKEVIDDYREAGITLGETKEQAMSALAQEVGVKYQRELRGELGAADDERLVKLLGDKFRERFRGLDSAAMKAAKKAVKKAEAKADAKESNGKSTISQAEWNSEFGR